MNHRNKTKIPKKIYYFPLLFTILLSFTIIACSDNDDNVPGDSDPTPDDNAQTVSVLLTFTATLSDLSTRTDYEEDYTNQSLKVKWAEGDALGLYTTDNDYNPDATVNRKVTLTHISADRRTATFSTELTWNTKTMQGRALFYYPYDKNITTNNPYPTYTLMPQTIADLPKINLMTGSVQFADVRNPGTFSLPMKHKTTLISIQVTNSTKTAVLLQSISIRDEKHDDSFRKTLQYDPVKAGITASGDAATAELTGIDRGIHPGETYTANIIVHTVYQSDGYIFTFTVNTDTGSWSVKEEKTWDDMKTIHGKRIVIPIILREQNNT